MFKVLSIVIIYTCLINTSIGQVNRLILTEAQNNSWFDSLSNSSPQDKLNLINQRLLDDTAVFIKKSYSDVVKGNYQRGSKVEGYGKPILLIDGDYFLIKNYSETKEIIKLTKLLILKNIKSITVLKATDPKTTALFGQMGENGAILLKLTNKRIAKKFTKLKI